MSDENAQGAETSLADIRQKIDAIDREIFERLVQRSALVTSVGEIKAASGVATPLRPRREADQLQQLAAWYSAAQPDMPFTSIVAIWREIIGSALAQQGGLRVHVTAATAQLARLYFGAAIDYHLIAETVDLAMLTKGGDIIVLEPQALLAAIDQLPPQVQCFARLGGAGQTVGLAIGCFDEELIGSSLLSVIPRDALSVAMTCLAEDDTQALVESMETKPSGRYIGRYEILLGNDREER
jgi:chorismate mutase